MRLSRLRRKRGSRPIAVSRFAALHIEDVGVGVASDVGTAFFTTATLANFFDVTVAADERQRRRALFADLTGRQEGQKGTLLYDNGRSRIKCYFEEALEEVTCGSTGKVRVRGKTYESLFAYYRSEIPELPVTEEAPVVRVSFPRLDRPQPVAADRVWVRVMNENVPDPLRAVDRIAPASAARGAGPPLTRPRPLVPERLSRRECTAGPRQS